MNNKGKYTNRELSAIKGAIFPLSLIVGLIVYSITDLGIGIILWIMLIMMGIAIAVLSPALKNRSTDFGPNNTDYSLVTGVLVAVIGFAGYLWDCTDIGWLAPVVVILATISILAIFLTMKNRTAGSD